MMSIGFEKAVKFQRLTEADSLIAVVGAWDSQYDVKYKRDFPHIFKIMKLCSFLIAIYECSDSYPDDLKGIISYGPSKMSVSTEVKYAYPGSFGCYI